jgi:penicillin-binding protein-related factor A (putative recombinase)
MGFWGMLMKKPSNITRPPAPKEADITRSIRYYLKSRNIFHFKQWQGLGSAKGVSDIIGIFNGRFLAIEVKTKRGKLSEQQQAFIDKVNIEGGIAFVARSVSDVINHLE